MTKFNIPAHILWELKSSDYSLKAPIKLIHLLTLTFIKDSAFYESLKENHEIPIQEVILDSVRYFDQNGGFEIIESFNSSK